jgi:hypothetical protein
MSWILHDLRVDVVPHIRASGSHAPIAKKETYVPDVAAVVQSTAA